MITAKNISFGTIQATDGELHMDNGIAEPSDIGQYLDPLKGVNDSVTKLDTFLNELKSKIEENDNSRLLGSYIQELERVINSLKTAQNDMESDLFNMAEELYKENRITAEQLERSKLYLSGGNY